ncbi:MAG TPA: type II toxin-antitoxin system prevent-host-death family antitoxin [Gaiella sp.]|jgi:prevent-host-death family protein|nr:type II toxin-antitoxin system prevent-host-death family antitoxin [Gaiella sp.]
MESMNVADAKRRFSELLDRVAAGEPIMVTRRGKPAAALVPPLDAPKQPDAQHVGLLAFAGALAEWPEFEEIMRDVVADRANHPPRPAPRFDP